MWKWEDREAVIAVERNDGIWDEHEDDEDGHHNCHLLLPVIFTHLHVIHCSLPSLS